MNELQVFKNEEFGDVRTLTLDGEPYFVGKDVAEVLGYSNPRDAIAKHVDDEDKNTVAFRDGTSGNPNITVINESGLYSLVLSSKLPGAKAFKRWITHEVIPAIRRTGGYVSNEDMFINTYLPYADEQTKTLFRSTLETVRSLNDKIERMKPKELFADAVSVSDDAILIGALAKIINQNGVNIGQKRLFAWLRDNSYLIKTGGDYNMPTQKAMNLGLFKIKERTINNPDGSVRITKTVLVTGKGQQYFINKFLAS